MRLRRSRPGAPRTGVAKSTKRSGRRRSVRIPSSDTAGRGREGRMESLVRWSRSVRPPCSTYATLQYDGTCFMVASAYLIARVAMSYVREPSVRAYLRYTLAADEARSIGLGDACPNVPAVVRDTYARVAACRRLIVPGLHEAPHTPWRLRPAPRRLVLRRLRLGPFGVGSDGPSPSPS